ncbi:MAG TPA: flagellar motor switch protein FliM, partial [Candidatus Paceibacterota bacterium]|nr:flagellar motor switch protein FliM [Candidatus Paceibacterota bacterium]
MDPTPEEILSQADVERLLAQVAEQETSTTIVRSDGQKTTSAGAEIQPYDFRQPAFLSAAELRKLRLRHEVFTRSLAARLSMYLRLEFGLQMSKLQTMIYQKFLDNLPNPTHLTLFKVEPMRGICILDVPPKLGITIVDRLMGGAAHSVNLERDMSDIEVALLDQVVQIILSEWCNQWAQLSELRPTVLGHENNGRFLQTASHDTVMLALTLEARVGDCLEPMQIGFPYYTLEPLVQQLNANIEATGRENPTVDNGGLRWNPQLNSVRVPVTAEWEGLEITARDLTQLQV